jgi:hypothetical protein
VGECPLPPKWLIKKNASPVAVATGEAANNVRKTHADDDRAVRE